MRNLIHHCTRKNERRKFSKINPKLKSYRSFITKMVQPLVGFPFQFIVSECDKAENLAFIFISSTKSTAIKKGNYLQRVFSM